MASLLSAEFGANDVQRDFQILDLSLKLVQVSNRVPEMLVGENRLAVRELQVGFFRRFRNVT